jgi:hypothetical protein
VTRWVQAMAASLVAASLAGCVSASPEGPAWYQEQNASAPGTFPNLRDVPRGTAANTDPAHWAALKADVLAAAAEMRANPRSQPASLDQDAAEFVDAARRELEAARDAHPQ